MYAKALTSGVTSQHQPLGALRKRQATQEQAGRIARCVPSPFVELLSSCAAISS